MVVDKQRSIKTQCPHCQAGYTVPEQYEGKRAKCSNLNCEKPFTVTPFSETMERERFFHFVPENLEVLKFLLSTRSRNPIGILFRGLVEHIGFFKGAHGWTWGTAEGIFVYMFTSPFYVFTYGGKTSFIEGRIQRMESEPIQVTSPPQAKPVDLLGFLAGLGPWGFFNIIKRGKKFAQEANRMCWRRVRRPVAFLPFGGYAAAKALLRHFESETATLVADPDNGLYDTYLKYEVYPGRDFDWHVWKEQLTERAEFYRGHPLAWSFFRNPRKKLNDLIDALNRHLDYHQRVVQA